jgi:4-amino-4-deoxy-L-arabinose transferase-like glycosyltransferase
VSYTFTVLPESLLASLVMANAAATLHLSARPRLRWSAAAGLTLSAAMLTKPVAVALLAGAPVVFAISWRHPRRVRLLGIWLAAVALPVLLASTGNFVRAGVFSPQAMGGYALLGVTGTFMPDDTPVAPPALGAALADELRPLRDELQRLDSLDMYYLYSSNAYHAAIERSREVILTHLRREHPGDSEQQLFLRLNTTGHAVARQTVLRAPRAYLRHVAAHLYGLWMMPLVQNASNRERLNERLHSVRDLAPRLASEPVMFRFVPPAVYWPFRMLLGVALAASIALVFAWTRNTKSTRWRIGAYASLQLHAYLLLTAAAQTGLPRYAMTAWPLTMLVAGCGAAAMLRATRARLYRSPLRPAAD